MQRDKQILQQGKFLRALNINGSDNTTNKDRCQSVVIVVSDEIGLSLLACSTYPRTTIKVDVLDNRGRVLVSTHVLKLNQSKYKRSSEHAVGGNE